MVQIHHNKNFTKFWRSHQNAAIPEEVKKLLEGMLCYDVSERMSIAQIMKHPWYNGTTLGKYTLQMVIQDRYTLSERRRRQEIKRNISTANAQQSKRTDEDLVISIASIQAKLEAANTSNNNGIYAYPMILYPYDDRQECLNGGVYTYGWNNTKPIYDCISIIITSDYNGECEYKMGNKLYCSMISKNTFSPNREEVQIHFTICIYKSRLWLNKYKESDDDIEDIEANKEDIIYIVYIERTDGDELLFRQIKIKFY